MGAKIDALYKRHGSRAEVSAGPVIVGKVPVDSRLLTPKHLQSSDFTKAAKGSFGNVALLMLSGNKAHNPDDETSATPAWRKAIVHAIGMKIPFVMNMDGFRELAPESGSYCNEVRMSTGSLTSLHCEILLLRATSTNPTGNNPSGVTTMRSCRRLKQSTILTGHVGSLQVSAGQ
jgi:hypothetical protein